jgi:hypothetical protein
MLLIALFLIAVLVAHFATAGLRGRLSDITIIAIFGALLCGMAYSSFNSRCPACNTGLGAGVRRANFCSHCGVRLKADASTRGDGA